MKKVLASLAFPVFALALFIVVLLDVQNDREKQQKFREEMLKEIKSLNNNIYKIGFVLEKQRIDEN
ncbi:MAG: hypothetical protein J5I47_13545 [Vicingus serpentipes]|nr:hypothetical protein [Vicingus serpentipes]